MSLSSLTLAFSILAASFLGSWHCAAMCGPIATLMHQRKSLAWYQVGRLCGYLLLGLLAGWLGQSTLKSDIAWLRILAGALMGLTLILGGISLLFSRQGLHFAGQKWLFSLQQKVTRVSFKQTAPFAGFITGLLTLFLPCGWLYSYAFASAATQSAWGGALVMFLFWLGGLPAMSALPWMLKDIIDKNSPHRRWLASMILIAAGLYSLIAFFLTH